jgi:hypothetical protein
MRFELVMKDFGAKVSAKVISGELEALLSYQENMKDGELCKTIHDIKNLIAQSFYVSTEILEAAAKTRERLLQEEPGTEEIID